MKFTASPSPQRLLALLIGLAFAAQTVFAAEPNPADQAPMVQWLQPALPTVAKQTKEQEDAGIQSGRAAPARLEILQPTLDPGLQSYQPRKDIQLSGSFKGAASDVLPHLVKLWIDKFLTYYPNVSISVPPPYAGSLGAKELVKGTLDFVFVSRELKPSDLTEFNARFGYNPLSVPISGGSYRHFGFLDAIGFFVNKDNPLEKISFDQLDAIYSSTHLRGGKPITTWGQLGLTGEWADKPIHAHGIKPWNGFEEFIRQRVLSKDGKRGEWREDINYDKLVFPLAGHGAEDRYAIGYAGLAYIDAGVKMIPVSDTAKGPFYAPSYENVALADYPLSRLIYFNTNKAPGKPLNPVVQEFLRFILSKEGQQLVLDNAIYVPLREQQVESSRTLIQN